MLVIFILLETLEYNILYIPTQYLIVACPLGSYRKSNIELLRPRLALEKVEE